MKTLEFSQIDALANDASYLDCESAPEIGAKNRQLIESLRSRVFTRALLDSELENPGGEPSPGTVAGWVMQWGLGAIRFSVLPPSKVLEGCVPPDEKSDAATEWRQLKNGIEAAANKRGGDPPKEDELLQRVFSGLLTTCMEGQTAIDMGLPVDGERIAYASQEQREEHRTAVKRYYEHLAAGTGYSERKDRPLEKRARNPLQGALFALAARTAQRRLGVVQQ